MPKRYEAMRDKFADQGMDLPAAKTKAAKIYNSARNAKEPKLSNQPEGKKAKVSKGSKGVSAKDLSQGYQNLGSAKAVPGKQRR